MLKEKLIEKTVFSLVYPETEALVRELYQGEDIYIRHRAGYTRVQDEYHNSFRDTYLYWAKPAVKGLYSFPAFYPSSGSSEAIREVIAQLGSQYLDPVLHMFEGEYEGYRAYAVEHNVEIKYWPREGYQEGLAKFIWKSLSVEGKSLIGRKHVFFISQPSGIDGMVWEGFKDFIQFAEKSSLEVCVDLAYVGTVATDYFIELDSPTISTVFISLSKSFGTYGRRIGGVFTREPLGGLYGNMWFKNYDSLYIGEKLLEKYNVYQIPQDYAEKQDGAIRLIKDKWGIEWEDIYPCDVILLARVHNASKYGLENFVRLEESDNACICITPAMDFLI